MSNTGSPTWLRRHGLWLTLVALLNSGYLLATGNASLFYIANVLGHVLLAVAVVALWGGIAAALFKQDAGRNPLFAFATLTLMLMAAGTGLALLVFGNHNPQRPVLLTHIVSSFGACLFVLLWLRDKSPRLAHKPGWFAATLAVLILSAAIPASRPWWPATGTDVIINPPLPPAVMADEAMGGEEGPFFPSSAETLHGDLIPGEFFLDSDTCGRSGCHPDMVEQWASSAHRFSSFNNQWYRKSIEYMQDVVGTQPPQWCAGCHDHALLFSGQMNQPVADFIETPEAHAGLACVSCHSVVAVKGSMGNGGIVLEYPEMHALANSDNPFVQAVHDFIVKIDPEPHKRTFLKPFHREQPAEFCASCHKVHLDVPVNNYRWLRGFNAYDNWQASGVSGQGARWFYQPPSPLNCLDCHMPRVPSDDAGNHDGLIRSHRFIAANTALPTANQDSVQLAQTIAFLQNNQVLVDIFAVSEPSETPPPAPGEQRRANAESPEMASTFAVGEEQGIGVGSGGLTREAVNVFAPLTDGAAVLTPGTSVRLDVVVRTLGLGHFFPDGTVDAQEAWLEVKAVDAAGKHLLWSGWVEDDDRGPVDPSAHFFRNLMVDAHANPVNKRNAWANRAVVYVNLIPPGAANTAHYRLQVPRNVSGDVTITARLRYRKFDWWHTQFSYAGATDTPSTDSTVTPDYDDRTWTFTGDTQGVSGKLKHIPDVPIVTMATDTVRLAVAPMLPPAQKTGTAADRRGWNDYGIGLLLQGDLKGAEQAFLHLTRIDPDYADGWVNLARVYVQEGHLEEAAAALAEADARQPGYHKVRFFRGLYHKALGNYPEALEDLMAARATHPTDRVVLAQIGRVHYLSGEMEQARDYFEEVLTIDAEDLMAHYNLMLTYRALGNLERSKAHEVRYLRFKDDETTQALARRYRQKDPHANNEAQPIHEHHHNAPPFPHGGPLSP